MAEIPLYAKLGLTAREYELVVEANGRPPSDFELAVYSLLWSEHCGYKHSRLLLRDLPSDGPRVLQGPGENAGVIDVGDGLAVAFKVESHNHPSAVEPFQGAATGVGGILRDIFAMGARPIAILDSLRFGGLESERSRRLLDGAVRGIGHYGNCVGVPNVGGEVVFEPGYERNCLVNAMCVGLLRQDRLQTATAAGVGNLVVLFGSRTGRDGIGGASVLASADLSDDDDRRPSVQVGDPFTGKKLIECCLELVEAELLVSLQDLGAAGLASSASEMASRGPVGLELDLDRVPLREAGLEPFEIMISESQERMVAIVEPALVDRVAAVCRRWDLEFAAIGEVVEGDRLVCRADGEIVGDMPVSALVDGCPRYPLEPVRPARLATEPVRPRPLPGAGRSLRHPPRPPRRPEHRFQGLGLRPVRPGRRLGNRRPPRRRRRRRAVDAVEPRDRRRPRRQRPPHVPRAPARRAPRGRRGGAQRRLHRRHPGRDHELPQLRQPRAGRDAVHARPRRSPASPRPPGPWARPSSPATSRSTTSTRRGRSRRPRSSAASAPSRTPRVPSRRPSRRPGTPSAGSARRLRRSTARSTSGRSTGGRRASPPTSISPARRPCTVCSAAPPPPASSSPATTWPTEASP